MIARRRYGWSADDRLPLRVRVVIIIGMGILAWALFAATGIALYDIGSWLLGAP